VKTSSLRLKTDFFRTHQHKTDCLAPDAKSPHNANSGRPHHRRHNSVIYISCYQSRHRQNLCLMFPHRTNDTIVQSSVTYIGYYISGRLTGFNDALFLDVRLQVLMVASIQTFQKRRPISKRVHGITSQKTVIPVCWKSVIDF
jgi:hypothetical protein